MSEVKRYGSAVFDSGLIEMACGDYVTYSDYQKLVAENAALKDVVGLTVNNLYASGYEAKQNSMHPWESLIFEGEKAMSTPSTDAAIAEIKAQGVDEFKDWNDTHIEIGDEYADILREVSKACSIFAANLRAGRKG